MSIVKVCGLTDKAAVSAAVESGADMVGFVFYPPSPRNLTIEEAAELAKDVPGHIQIVGVFVDPGDDVLAATAKNVPLDIIQLHGGETVARVSDVKTRFGLPVIKAVAVRNKEDILAGQAYGSVADRVLYDAKAPEDQADALPGGNGVTFDWSLIAVADPAAGWMLSGGLDVENVVDALRRTNAAGVDVSSGVEQAPGVKDVAKVAAFVRAARRNKHVDDNS